MRSRKQRRCYCLLPEGADHAEARNAGLHCGVGGHAHLSFVEVYGEGIDFAAAGVQIQRQGANYLGSGGMLERGEVEWFIFPNILIRASLNKCRSKGRFPRQVLLGRIAEEFPLRLQDGTPVRYRIR